MTVVVTGFLFGVGIGSLSGGRFSRTATIPLLAVFGLIEIAIGAFGAISLQVFQWAGARTLHLPTIAATAATLVLVIIPSLFMGATLPILTQYFVPRARNVGRTVGLLYCTNTLGSAAACFISDFWLMRLLGMQNSVHVAAAINVLAGITVLWLTYWHRPENQATPAETHPVFKMRGVASREQRSNLFFAFLVSVVTAYVSLSYEVIWFRAFIIGTNQTQAFPLILGAYLGGLAVGSCWIRRYFAPAASNTRLLYMLCIVILLSSVLGFSVLPLAAQAASLGGQNGFVFITLLLVFAQTVIAGITFPLLCHVGFTADDRAGFHLSLVYVGNILGSAAGTLLTGFILMDFMSTAQISVLLAALGAIAAASVAGLAQMSWPRRAAFIAASLTMVISSPLTIKSLFDHYYERIIYKNKLSREAACTMDWCRSI
jgi:predicted membrane-bound spermidine synthase